MDKRKMLIRKAEKRDLSRVAEIFVFNNRINYFPIFKDAVYSFGTLQVVSAIDNYFGKEETFGNLFVVEDDGIIKGFIEIRKTEIVKLYVEPLFQSCGTGGELIEFALQNFQADFLWALEKNTRAISFYRRHGFFPTGARKHEEGTAEYIVELRREQA